MPGRRGVAGLVLALLAGLAWAQGDSFAFIPDGGRGLLALAFPDPAARQSALTQRLSEAEWQAALPKAGLTAPQRQTLAAWLARVAPLADPSAPLPADGRDLALAQCQSCHSLFTGYLMQRRDRAGWRMIFASPFHANLPMTPTEREIFADYSALNMPLRLQDVPPEMRF